MASCKYFEASLESLAGGKTGQVSQRAREGVARYTYRRAPHWSQGPSWRSYPAPPPGLAPACKVPENVFRGEMVLHYGAKEILHGGGPASNNI